MEGQGIDSPREVWEAASGAAGHPKAQCHPLLCEHLGGEMERQNRFQEASLVDSQRGKKPSQTKHPYLKDGECMCKTST